MLTDQKFLKLVRAASLAPSADNMQPWEFRKRGDMVEIFPARQRLLPTDVMGMFTWVSIGAAIQNMVVAAAADGMVADVAYSVQGAKGGPAAVVRLVPGDADGRLADWIALRTTNRSNYETLPLESSMVSGLMQNVNGIPAGVHWMTGSPGLEQMASMDARSSFIRLEHKPLHDELFGILRFTKKQMEATRYGLDFQSLGVPYFAVRFARQLQHWSVNRAVSRLGIGRIVAKMLASRLCQAGALCLITATRRDPAGYMEAGRAMEHLWLDASSRNLSVHPYGVLPQYLTKVEIEPETFLPGHVTCIQNHRGPFYSLFPGAINEFPAIVLRVGRSDKQSVRNCIRLDPEALIRS